MGTMIDERIDSRREEESSFSQGSHEASSLRYGWLESRVDHPSWKRHLADGRQMDLPLLDEMESRFGHRFGSIRIEQSDPLSFGDESAYDTRELEASQLSSRIMGGALTHAARCDLSQVRLHSDESASAWADRLQARAFTIGSHIFLRSDGLDSGSHEGQGLLAHELVHVMQQNPATQGRIDLHTSPPMLMKEQQQYNYNWPALVPMLNDQSISSSEYATAVNGWPNDSPLWPFLSTRAARERFIRYIVGFDMTNCRPYGSGRPQSSSCQGFARAQETFRNLCTGYATQMYVRYYNAPPAGRLSAEEVERLSTMARVHQDTISPKFRMPIFIATVPGHSFNAVLVDDSSAGISSYIFLEPQTDELFDSASSLFQNYMRIGVLQISRLRSFSTTGQYGHEDVATFLRSPAGAISQSAISLERRLALQNILSALLIAGDWDAWVVTVMGVQSLDRSDHIRRIQIDESYRSDIIQRFRRRVRESAQSYSDQMLSFVASYAIGRQFSRYPLAPVETLTRDEYIALVARPTLGGLLQ
ncbi:MAG: DUF4157 domain-containing protein [Methanotrichaceae archaeon]|nr:DUF4157 domain-containing protein [Methanotrichaceae archaeon]